MSRFEDRLQAARLRMNERIAAYKERRQADAQVLADADALDAGVRPASISAIERATNFHVLPTHDRELAAAAQAICAYENLAFASKVQAEMTHQAESWAIERIPEGASMLMERMSHGFRASPLLANGFGGAIDDAFDPVRVMLRAYSGIHAYGMGEADVARYLQARERLTLHGFLDIPGMPDFLAPPLPVEPVDLATFHEILDPDMIDALLESADRLSDWRDEHGKDASLVGFPVPDGMTFDIVHRLYHRKMMHALHSGTAELTEHGVTLGEDWKVEKVDWAFTELGETVLEHLAANRADFEEVEEEDDDLPPEYDRSISFGSFEHNGATIHVHPHYDSGFQATVAWQSSKDEPRMAQFTFKTRTGGGEAQFDFKSFSRSINRSTEGISDSSESFVRWNDEIKQSSPAEEIDAILEGLNLKAALAAHFSEAIHVHVVENAIDAHRSAILMEDEAYAALERHKEAIQAAERRANKHVEAARSGGKRARIDKLPEGKIDSGLGLLRIIPQGRNPEMFRIIPSSTKGTRNVIGHISGRDVYGGYSDYILVDRAGRSEEGRDVHYAEVANAQGRDMLTRAIGEFLDRRPTALDEAQAFAWSNKAEDLRDSTESVEEVFRTASYQVQRTRDHAISQAQLFHQTYPGRHSFWIDHLIPELDNSTMRR